MTTTETLPMIIISEDPHETMMLAGQGPEFTAEAIMLADDPHISDEGWDRLETIREAQAEGEADYLLRWRQAAQAEGLQRGYRVSFATPGEDAHRRGTSTPYNDDGDTIERVVWQAAHEATALPEGWAR